MILSSSHFALISESEVYRNCAERIFFLRDNEQKPNETLARPRRVELLTSRSVVWRSIQLSYGRNFNFNLNASFTLHCCYFVIT